MKYRANAGVGDSKGLIMKGEVISEEKFESLSPRMKSKFVAINLKEVNPPGHNVAVGDSPVDVIAGSEKKVVDSSSQPSSIKQDPKRKR
ncbi:MAG: hypothetical protein PHX51_07115 [Clostridia bacterium]|nr:hypothetical protein [Clostridia bacterium]